ncbi:hypothetical protein AB0J68_07015 [Micromonospora sp. NPDC049580]|uniref:hypothetical protein n=1 Tax=Micromonospora sp. NPDC049580 TaxID=3154832 RepID=UPI0034481474
MPFLITARNDAVQASAATLVTERDVSADRWYLNVPMSVCPEPDGGAEEDAVV